MRDLEIIEKPPRIFHCGKRPRLGLGQLLGLTAERRNPVKQTARWLWRKLANAWSWE